MVFFRRRGKPDQKKLVTKSVNTYFTSAHYTYNINTNTDVQAAVNYPLNKSAYSTDFSSSAIYSSGQTVTGQVYYGFDFTQIPEDAQNIKLTLSAGVKAENPNQDEHYFAMRFVWIGSSGGYSSRTAVLIDSDSYTITQTTITVNDILVSGKTEREMLDSIFGGFAVGYYGGYISGATLTVTYDIYE